MAKKRNINRTQAVMDYLLTHPEATRSEIASSLHKQGIKITLGHVSNIKSRLKSPVKVKEAARLAAVVVETAAALASVPAAIEKPAKPGNTITLERVRKVAATINAMGGFQRMVEVLEVIKEAGGVKKFRDLAEAMACPAIDEIPF